jgi:hypothetical protein
MKKILFLIALGPAQLVLAHTHLEVGANRTAPNSPLAILSAGYSTDANYAFDLNHATSGPYAGYFQTGDLSFSSKASYEDHWAAPGTQVRLRFLSVTGPTGGSFGVWDVEGFNWDELDATALTFSLPVGTTNGTNSILLSENNGEPGAEVYGHIHGRHYSATKPGLYIVTVQAYDGAHNGPGGSPIHTPSAPFSIYFQAGDQIAAITKSDSQVDVLFPTKIGSFAFGTDYYLQATTNLTTATWETVAGPVTGDNYFHTLSDTDATAPQRYYRLLLTPTP